MKQAINTVLIVVIGSITINYWLTDKMEMREPLIGCWPILDPLLGFCF
jgi:hypothetical protein